MALPDFVFTLILGISLNLSPSERPRIAGAEITRSSALPWNVTMTGLDSKSV